MVSHARRRRSSWLEQWRVAGIAATTLAVHLAFILVAARLFSLDLEEALVASNACALGAPTAAAMALSFRRNDLAVPAMLCGVLGYAVGNFVGLAIYAVVSKL